VTGITDDMGAYHYDRFVLAYAGEGCPVMDEIKLPLWAVILGGVIVPMAIMVLGILMTF
jgi:hypothetical protein